MAPRRFFLSVLLQEFPGTGRPCGAPERRVQPQCAAPVFCQANAIRFAETRLAAALCIRDWIIAAEVAETLTGTNSFIAAPPPQTAAEAER